MPRITTSRTIDAPIEDVFEVTAHIDSFTKAIPHIVGIEFLTEQTRGAGTRFRETRQMGRRTATTELEVDEYEPPHRVRMISDAGGTIWDTVFDHQEVDGSTELTMTMESRPYKPLAKLFVPLFNNRVAAAAVADDMDAVKRYFEPVDRPT